LADDEASAIALLLVEVTQPLVPQRALRLTEIREELMPRIDAIRSDKATERALLIF